MTPTVIAFCSPVMGSGKSAAAAHLVTEHGFQLVKFAAPLKDMTRALLPHLGVEPHLVERHVEGDRKEALLPGFGSLSARRIMQTLGTEWGRDTIRRDFWTAIVRERCEAEMATGRSVVIDDMRYRNEYDTIRDIGGLVYRIVRPDAGSDVTGHNSEGELDQVAMPEIWNRQGLDRLHEKLDLLIRESR